MWTSIRTLRGAVPPATADGIRAGTVLGPMSSTEVLRSPAGWADGR